MSSTQTFGLPLAVAAIAVIAALGATAAACDPVVVTRASIRSAGNTPETERALEGAEVAEHCPDRQQDKVLGTTDAEGEFETKDVGTISNKCSVVVRKNGYEPVIYPVQTVCRNYSSNGCISAEITADLRAKLP